MAAVTKINAGQRSISNFKTKLTGGGARPNLFEVVLNFPSLVTKKTTADDEVAFMVKAAELPASNLGDIPVSFRGRILHVPGDRTFDPWTVTIINNTDWALRQSMEEWSNIINDRQYDMGNQTPLDYQQDAVVHQLSRNLKKGTTPTGGTEVQKIASYNFFGMWPSQISSVPLDYGSTDAIEEFQVTFQVEYWTPTYQANPS